MVGRGCLPPQERRGTAAAAWQAQTGWLEGLQRAVAGACLPCKADCKPGSSLWWAKGVCLLRIC